MLAFGIKVAWFSLSLSGFLSSLVALPAFAQALDGYLLPVLYVLTNFGLQGFFCLGMIWRMDPLKMPRAFCVAQPILQGVSWTSMTAVTTCISIATSLAILRPAGGVPASPAYIRGQLRLHPICLLITLFPLGAFAAYLALALRFDAIQPTDGMNCDATDPTWVRLLSYSGVPLLLALPSCILTCTAAVQFYAHSPLSRSFRRAHDRFTSVPLRRQSKFKLNQGGWQEAKSFDHPRDYNDSMPQLSLTATGPSTDQRSVTPSGTIVVAEAIPSPPDSLSSARARAAQGRAPISPGVVNPGQRYHLPFQWQPPSPHDSLRSRDGGDSQDYYLRSTPSPLVFAVPADERRPGTTMTMISILPEDTEKMLYDAAPWLKDEKTYLRQLEKVRGRELRHQIKTTTTPHENENDDEHYDAVSGSLRWVRESGETASTAKSELEFARTPQREAFDEPTLRRSPPVDSSTYDAGLTEPPIGAQAVWRILFFQVFTSATQIVATVSSLVDMFAQHEPPAPFGTQHVALVLLAWAPPIAFGVFPLPWLGRKPKIEGHGAV